MERPQRLSDELQVNGCSTLYVTTSYEWLLQMMPYSMSILRPVTGKLVFGSELLLRPLLKRVELLDTASSDTP